MEDKKKKPTCQTTEVNNIHGTTPSPNTDWIVSVPSTRGTYTIEKEDKDPRDKKRRTV